MNNFTIILTLFLSTLGPSIVIAFVGAWGVKSLARNPSAAPEILTALVFAFLFSAGISFGALLIVYLLFQ